MHYYSVEWMDQPARISLHGPGGAWQKMQAVTQVTNDALRAVVWGRQCAGTRHCIVRKLKLLWRS